MNEKIALLISEAEKKGVGTTIKNACDKMYVLINTFDQYKQFPHVADSFASAQTMLLSMLNDLCEELGLPNPQFRDLGEELVNSLILENSPKPEVLN